MEVFDEGVWDGGIAIEKHVCYWDSMSSKQVDSECVKEGVVVIDFLEDLMARQ
jgi:hypothetical protein